MFFSLLIYFSAVALLSVSLPKRIVDRFVIAGLICGVLIDGLRIETGTDWLPYYTHFTTFNEASFTDYDHFEIGYQYLVWGVKSIWNDYTFFTLILASITYFGIYFSVYKLSNSRPLSIVMLYGSLNAMLGSNRQLLALFFLVLSVQYLFQRRWMLFISLILFGSLFHKSILVFLPFYFLYGLSWRGYVIAFSGLIALNAMLISKFSGVIALLDQSGSYSSYFDNATDTMRPALALGKKFAVLGGIFFLGAKSIQLRLIGEEKDKTMFFAFCTLVSVLLYVVGMYGLSVFNSRLDIYFGITFYAVLGGQVESLIQNKFRKFLLVAFLIVTAVINFSLNPFFDLFSPYKSIFINTDFVRNLY